MDLLARFRKSVIEHELVEPGEKVLIALSGGPDSTALLHLFSRLQKELDLTLGAVYVNHQLRPKAAAKEEQFCQRLCDRLHIELDIATEHMRRLAQDRGGSIEVVAREFRYELFEALALDEQFDRVALGHHRDDQTETILFRLIRGTGLDGLTGIPIKRGRIIRPLLEMTKQELLDYLKTNQLGYCHDRSNDSIKIRRNFIRHRLLPLVRAHLNPKADEAIARLSDLARADLPIIDRIVEAAFKRTVKRTPGGKFELVLARLRGYDGAVIRRIFRSCLRELSPSRTSPDREVVERLIELVDQEGKKLSLPERLIALNEAGKLALYRQGRLTFKLNLIVGKLSRLQIPRLNFKARVADGGLSSIITQPRSRKVAVDLERVSLPLVVRSLKPGDRFRPLGMAGSKKLSDYLIDAKWPAYLRDEIALVCDQKGIVWVAGLQIEDRVKITSKTKRVLFLEFSRRNQG